MSNDCIPERRQRQSELIRQCKPWQKSTGPITEAGKLKVSKNALIENCDQFSIMLLNHMLNQQAKLTRSLIHNV